MPVHPCTHPIHNIDTWEISSVKDLSSATSTRPFPPRKLPSAFQIATFFHRICPVLFKPPKHRPRQQKNICYRMELRCQNHENKKAKQLFSTSASYAKNSTATASDCRAALIQPSISNISTTRQTNKPGALHHLFSHRERDRYTIAPSAIRTHCRLENNLVRTYVNSIYPFSNRPLERAIFSVISFTASNRPVYALVSLPIFSLWNIVIAASGSNAQNKYTFYWNLSLDEMPS